MRRHGLRRAILLAVATGAVGVSVLLPMVAGAAPVPVPPVPLPPIRVPTLPSPLDKAVPPVGPLLAYDCVLFASVSTVAGLGSGAVASQVPSITFQNLPSWVALIGLPCGAATVSSFYDCTFDHQLAQQLQSVGAQLASVTNLPVGIVLGIAPLPLDPIAMIAETLDGVASAAGQGGQLDSTLASLGCVSGANASPGTSVGSPLPQPGGLVPRPAATGASPSVAGDASPSRPSPVSSPSATRRPETVEPVASPAVRPGVGPLAGVTSVSPASAAAPADRSNSIAVIVLVGGTLAAAGLWAAAGRGRTSA